MSYLFDTVALSEAAKPKANPGFVAWLADIAVEDIYTSVLCLGEIRRGVETLAQGDKREQLTRWLEVELPTLLAARVLPVTDGVAQTWGRLGARRSLTPIDTLIGATAAVSRLTVVTRNVRDFDGLGVPVLNPWT